MRLFITALIILFPVCFFGQTQELDSLIRLSKVSKNDSLKARLLDRIGVLYERIDLNKALEYYEKGIKLSKEIDFPIGIYNGALSKSQYYRLSGEYEKSIKSLKEGIESLKEYNYPQGIINLNSFIGTAYDRMLQKDSAKVYLKKCIDEARRINYEKGLIGGLLGYGNILYSRNDLSNALIYYMEIDSICKSNNLNDTSCANALLNMGDIKRLMGEYVKAEEYYDNASTYYVKTTKHKESYNEVLYKKAILKLAENNFNESEKYFDQVIKFYRDSQNLPKLSRILSEVSNLYVKKGMFDSAEKSIEESISLSTKLKDSGLLSYALNELGYLKIKTKKFNEAPKYLSQAQNLALKQKDGRILAESSLRLSAAYYYNKDYKSSVEEYIKYNKFTDSMDIIQQKNQIASLETKYQTQQKEQEIALLKSQQELEQQKNKSQKNMLFAGLGLTTLAGIFLFILYRNRQKTNKQLQALDTAKSNFFANISHEFRTPLTLITNPIESALDDTSLPDKKREAFQMAKRNSERLLSLVNQLLDLSKIDAGQLKLQIQQGNLKNFVAALVDAFKYSAEQKDITYTVNIEKQDDEVWFDKDALEKIVVNLLSNAVKYTPSGGLVTCQALVKDNKFHFKVSNSGVGLTKEQLGQVFNRFYQTNEQNQGSGIGLALVKELVLLHKGEIKAENKPDGITEFSVVIPVDKQSLKNAEIIKGKVQKNIELIHSIDQVKVDDEVFEDDNKPILLIVEDNADVRLLLKETFKEDYNVIEAVNGAEGEELALEKIPDIIVSDIMMPVKDGIALTETLKNNELTSHIPIILLTAKAGDENQIAGIETGADDYITKPFNAKLLVKKVSNLIKIRQKLQKRYSQEIVLTPKDIAVTNIDEQFLNKVQQVLDKNLVESSFSVEEFSKAVGVSRMQLHRKIKALTGLSASEFVKSQRLKLAAELLKTSNINISQVGYSVGFNDHSYFTKVFKESYNCTPTQYAKKFGKL